MCLLKYIYHVNLNKMKYSSQKEGYMVWDELLPLTILFITNKGITMTTSNNTSVLFAAFFVAVSNQIELRAATSKAHTTLNATKGHYEIEDAMKAFDIAYYAENDAARLRNSIRKSLRSLMTI